jgi:calcineurin-like phosphoesterase family protein
MRRLNQLACSLPQCDVLALTGDCTSDLTDQLPLHWDEWPQRLKLSVPGNHDCSHTFNLLPNWYHRAPWTCRLNELTFIGIDSSNGFSDISHQLQQLNRPDIESGSALVLLSHRWPDSLEAKRVGEVLSELLNNRVLLVLHGHEHPSSFSGSLWEESANISHVMCYRSKVTSCSRPKRGRGHLITWENGGFRCFVVRSNDPRYESTGYSAA